MAESVVGGTVLVMSDTTPMATAMAEMLGRMGIAQPDTDTAIADEIVKICASMAVTAKIASLRYKSLVLETDPVDGAVLRYAIDTIVDRLAVVAPGAVDRVQIRVRTGRLVGRSVQGDGFAIGAN